MLPQDVYFDFTTDSPGFWEGFWERRGGLGLGGSDPDSASPSLKRFHRELWSRELPCGRRMELEDEYGGYLAWDGMRFSSDSITASFNYERCRPLIEDVYSHMDDHRSYVESYLRRTYTIGGCIIFPRHRNSINQCQGTNRKVSDRWDLTLECIRRFYEGEESPLGWCLEQDRGFFDLFTDFRGYVDFFLLQDCVTPDYSEVRIWTDIEPFVDDPVPRDRDEYLSWMDRNMEFVDRRNRRIAGFLG